MNDDLKSQLTAWALDELPAEEQARITQSLADSAEERAYADETRAFCSLLSRTLGTAAAELTPDQRTNLAKQLSMPPTSSPATASRAGGRRFVWAVGLGAAATVLAVWQLNTPTRRGQVVAQQAPATGPADRRGGSTEGEELGRLTTTPGTGGRLAEPADQPIGPAGSTPLVASFHLSDPGLARTEEIGRPADVTFDKAKRDEAALADLTGKQNFVGLEAKAVGEPAAADRGGEGLVAQNDKTPMPALVEAVTGPDTLAQLDAKQGLNPLADGFKDADAFAGGSLGGLPGAPVNRSLAVESRMRQAGPVPAKPAAPPDGEGVELLAKTKEATLSLADAIPGEVGGALGLKREVPPASAPVDHLYAEANSPVAPEARYFYRYGAPTEPAPAAESYGVVPENAFIAVATEPRSTFSIDVDTAAYANVRRFLNLGQRPPQSAVRLEEMVNYFRYDYPPPTDGKPFSVTVDLADCPWKTTHRLARVGLKGREIAAAQRPPSNLVFLIDVSGSMDEANKLPLVKQSLRLLGDQLTERDRVAMVTYAGQSGIVLDSTIGSDRAKISSAVDSLAAGGSTNGASGIQLAYQVAQQHFVKEGVNRVILATDGDFNVGLTSLEALQALITEKAKGGVFLSVLGFGMGNLKDSTMEMLSDKGNGNYAYIDSLSEARKVLGEEMSGTLVTIAKDVKIQVEFNPALVRSYRLLGYENRMLAKEDFNDDTKDAGEIGAGHTVTALYEVVPVGAPADVPPVDRLKYAPATAAPAVAGAPIDPAIARETMTVKLRYKAPDGDVSQAIDVPVIDREAKFADAPADFKFATGVAMFGMMLKDSAHKGSATWDQVRQFALEGKGPDALGYRGEFLQLIEKARGVAP